MNARVSRLTVMKGLGTAVALPLLEVKNLRVEFNTRRGTLVAVDDVSFDIAPGEVLGVVGESKASKSITDTAIIRLLERPGRVFRRAGAAGSRQRGHAALDQRQSQMR